MAPEMDGRGGAPVSFLRTLSDALNRASEALLFVLIMLMVIVTMAQVIFRFFFEAIVWSEELSTFLLVFASLVGAAVAFKRGSHLSISFLSDRLPPKARKVLATFVNLLGMGFFAIIAVYGVVLARAEMGQSTPAMQIPMGMVYLVYPLTAVVTMIHLLDALTGIWKEARK